MAAISQYQRVCAEKGLPNPGETLTFVKLVDANAEQPRAFYNNQKHVHMTAQKIMKALNDDPVELSGNWRNAVDAYRAMPEEEREASRQQVRELIQGASDVGE